ncbi:MAG: IS1 family transposase [Phycisphaerales bacterium]|nr:IS1 family transposase [Phycisphaerales bacterium]
MPRLAREQRIQVIRALCEGCSVNSTVRMTGIAKTSILRLLVDMGRVCMNHEDTKLRGLFCETIEADEIWGFNHCKARTLPRATAAPESAGDVWTWYCVDRHSKAILSWVMGDRDSGHAHALMDDLASRIIGRPELFTDALGAYADAVFDAFARTGVDYATIHKVYDNIETALGRQEAICTGCKKRSVFGSPRLERAGTSRIERANLTLRMSQRRWTRKTNAHSKAFANMQAAFALHAAFYNWARPHASLGGKTPAMVLGVANRVWTIGDLVGLLEADERAIIGTEQNKRGLYKPRKKS